MYINYHDAFAITLSFHLYSAYSYIGFPEFFYFASIQTSRFVSLDILFILCLCFNVVPKLIAL